MIPKGMQMREGEKERKEQKGQPEVVGIRAKGGENGLRLHWLGLHVSTGSGSRIYIHVQDT